MHRLLELLRALASDQELPPAALLMLRREILRRAFLGQADADERNRETIPDLCAALADGLEFLQPKTSAAVRTRPLE